jgi:hypothetical protein
MPLSLLDDCENSGKYGSRQGFWNLSSGRRSIKLFREIDFSGVILWAARGKGRFLKVNHHAK